ncbi:putative RNA-directed DNA polymerase from transposon BS [Trichonephila clavipes]|nr:putative RNA-directed DNA polymerase from transposon BS [Trichonephila clavipes]
MNPSLPVVDTASPVAQVIKGYDRGLGREPQLTSELRSLNGSLKILQSRNGVQIVALHETKLSEHTNIKLKKISIYCTDRPYESGGGLAFLVRGVNYKNITLPSRYSDLEMQGISITWKRRVINIFNLYHPLNQGHLPAEIFDCSGKNTIFLGDLNAKYESRGCSTNNDRSNDLFNAADDRALIFLNSGLPTHTSFSYGTSVALDITLVSPELHPHCDWDILSSIGSDYLPILINVQINRKTVTSHNKFWNFKKANWDCFQRITEGSLDKRTTMDNLEQKWHSFKQFSINVSKQSIPSGNFKHLKSYFQHRHPGLRTLILKRNALPRKLTLTGDREDKVKLNKLNASIKQLYIKLKREAWTGLCSNIDAKTPNTKFWKLAQSLSHLSYLSFSYNQPQNMPCNTVLTSDGKTAPDDKTAANVLGEFYKDAQNKKLNNHTVAALLDMSRVFDRVWRQLLITKLHVYFSIRGTALPWISDFLWDRSYRVNYNNCLSDPFAIRQGVPQGSVLSTVLFSLYITGIEKVLAKHCEVGIFADDIIVYSSGSDVGEYELKLNRADLELDGIYFHDQLLTSETKSSEIPALVNQLALESINVIPQSSLRIYTFGNRDDKGISGSGVCISTPSVALEFKIKNPNYCSVFKSELIAIRRGLQCSAQLGDRFQEIWILTDSRASIQHLDNWGNIGDQTSLDILSLFHDLSSGHSKHFQWFPLHVVIEGKERADFLARTAAVESVSPRGNLTFSEISTISKLELNRQIKTPPSHAWRQIDRPISKRNRCTTAQQVANQFLAASGKRMSRKTVARRLRGGELYARRPVVCVPLTRQHRTARLQWCREHHNWTEQDSACVLFSDESRFSLSSDYRRQLIWRESGTAYRPENIQEKDRYHAVSWCGPAL